MKSVAIGLATYGVFAIFYWGFEAGTWPSLASQGVFLAGWIWGFVQAATTRAS